jgi:hypothetical protein
MNAPGAAPALALALELSRQLLSLAEGGDIQTLPQIDAERRRLLDSVRPMIGRMSPEERRVLQEIHDLNDRAIGFLEHRRRRTERLIDTAAAGRRALLAYSSTRSQP